MPSFNCPNCKGSDIVERGWRHNKSGAKHRYRCNECHSTFVEPDGFEGMRHKREDIVRAVHQHTDGLSLFQVQNHLWQHDGVKVTRKTVSDWTKKFSVFLKSAKRTSKASYKRANTLR